MINEDNNILSKIKENNILRENNSLSEYACKSIDGLRKSPNSHNNNEFRPSFFQDTDKIIHSRSYTRYIDKTQVFYLFDNDNITHRVLHVQLVSKIARVLGRSLALNEDLIEAIALGHDIGHTPYGHTGESILKGICKDRDIGYFCHNAQSVRFLMEVENRGKGLDLTLQVLDGILCHNGEILDEVYKPSKNKTWQAFLEEYKKCWTVEDFDKKIRPMSLEACVVRISDVIAYIGRDIEDAIHLRLISREEIPEEVTKVLGNTNSSIVDRLVSDIIINSYGKNYIALSSEIYSALKTLLDFNYRKIYSNVVKVEQNDIIKNMFYFLFDRYLKDLNDNKESSSIVMWSNSMSKKYIESNNKERLVLDYIAGMTDEYFNNEFKRRVFPKRYGFKVEE
ncbi:deoxyguanosinetriphosphate triphosphohydrolase family protein [Natronospora cellulosivora (SeqCode)]